MINEWTSGLKQQIKCPLLPRNDKRDAPMIKIPVCIVSVQMTAVKPPEEEEY